MSTSEFVAPDQATSYGEQFHAVYDRLIPAGEGPEQTAAFLLGLVGEVDPVVIELGVGSGRIALPLARRGARVTGVDTSPHLLSVARASADRKALELRLVEADIRSWSPDHRADLVICVCATLAQLPTADDRRDALSVAAAAALPGGLVVVETHSPERVRRMHGGRRTVELALPLGGVSGADRAISELDDERALWRMEHHWLDSTGPRTATEYANLIEPEQLIELAASVGLVAPRLYADWAGAPADPLSPTYVCVLTRPPSPAESDRTVHQGETP